MPLSRYLAGFKKQACDNSSLMKQLGFSPGTKWSPFPLVLPVICFSRFKRRCCSGPVSLTSIPSWGKLSKMQIFLLVFINPMDSLSKEIFCEADCNSKKKENSTFFFPFRGVYTVPKKASWQRSFTFKASYPSLSMRINRTPRFFTISLQNLS